MGCSPAAWPSMRSWQAAALVVVLSCALGPGAVWKLGCGAEKILRELNQQTRAINKHALGRIVAGFERDRGIISGTVLFCRVSVHRAFRGKIRGRAGQSGPNRLVCHAVMRPSTAAARWDQAGRRAPAIRPENCPAVHQDSWVRRARAPVAEFLAPDFPEGSPVAARRAARAESADLRADRSASHRHSVIGTTEPLTASATRCS